MLLLVNMIFPTHEHALENTNGEKFSYPHFFCAIQSSGS